LITLRPPSMSVSPHSTRTTRPLALLSSPPLPTHPYTLSLHDALPISRKAAPPPTSAALPLPGLYREVWIWPSVLGAILISVGYRSEEHTSELQSHLNLVCRLLLEKKKYIVIVFMC